MEKTISSVDEKETTDVQQELQRLLASRKFSGAPQLSAFLRYIVEETLAGRGERIKAYTVGVDALGKAPTFDAQNDPSVRVLALRLRKTLAAIYMSEPESPTRIVLHPGTYMPEFHQAGSGVDEAQSKATSLRRSEGTTPAVSVDEPGHVETHQAQPTTAPIEVSAKRGVSSSRSENSNDGSAKAANGLVNGVVSGAVLLVGLSAWNMTQSNADTYKEKQASAIQRAAIVPAVPQQQHSALATNPVHVKPPTVHLHSTDKHSVKLQQVSMLLGSSMASTGKVDVIRQTSIVRFSHSSPSDYQLLLNEFSVDTQARIEAQVVHGVSGELVMSATLHMNQAGAHFSANDVKQIEMLASNIAERSGPVLSKYCQDQPSSAGMHCASTSVVAELDSVE